MLICTSDIDSKKSTLMYSISFVEGGVIEVKIIKARCFIYY